MSHHNDLHIEIRIAQKRSEVLQCQYLIASVYNQHYNIVFSDDGANLDAKIEPYPHRYIMGLVNGNLVATSGLYLHDTYVDRYGQVPNETIHAVLKQAGVADQYNILHKREYTKLVVKQGWEGHGIGRFFFAATHNRHFLQIDTREPCILVCCAKQSIFKNLYDVVGIQTRPLKYFPIYRVHEEYASPSDPMESRLIIPEMDINPSWYNLKIPGTYPILTFGGGHEF